MHTYCMLAYAWSLNSILTCSRTAVPYPLLLLQPIHPANAHPITPTYTCMCVCYTKSIIYNQVKTKLEYLTMPSVSFHMHSWQAGLHLESSRIRKMTFISPWPILANDVLPQTLDVFSHKIVYM